MEVTPEIEKIFASGAEGITQLELTYKNGGMVIGSIKKLRLSPLRLRPLRIVIQKSDPAKGERAKHKVVFEHVTLMRISFRDGSEIVFPS